MSAQEAPSELRHLAVHIAAGPEVGVKGLTLSGGGSGVGVSDRC